MGLKVSMANLIVWLEHGTLGLIRGVLRASLELVMIRSGQVTLSF
jgi:hypothetical protein